MSITVVIPSYRYGHLVAQAVESVLGQTRPPEKIMVVDDGVGDCREPVSKYHEMHRYKDFYTKVELIEREKNMGIVANFQDALMRVETDKTMFLGADNYLRPDALEVLDDVTADIVSYDIAVIGNERENFCTRVGASEVEDGYNIWRFIKGDISQSNYIHGSSLYDTKRAQAVGYRASGNARTEEDWMLFRGMLEAGASHAHISLPLLYYRRHSVNFNGNE